MMKLRSTLPHTVCLHNTGRQQWQFTANLGGFSIVLYAATIVTFKLHSYLIRGFTFLRCLMFSGREISFFILTVPEHLVDLATSQRKSKSMYRDPKYQ